MDATKLMNVIVARSSPENRTADEHTIQKNSLDQCHEDDHI